MQELETLLNSLVKRGWKPFNNDNLNYCDVEGGLVYLCTLRNPKEMAAANLVYETLAVPLRLITTIESGLWQFVCKNDLQAKWSNRAKNVRRSMQFTTITDEKFESYLSKYRLIESALIPEEELAKFLVENIIVEWKKE